MDAPIESVSQAAYFEWLKTVPAPGFPGKRLRDFAYHVPNGQMLPGGSKRRGKYMNFLKAQGLTPGVSDIVIALPVGRYHGAYLEMKRTAKSKVSDEQQKWLDLMKSAGYYSAKVPGLDSAIEHTKLFLRG